MLKKIQQFMGGTVSFLLFVAIWTLPMIFLMGADWTSEHLVNPLIAVGWSLLILNGAALLPLSIIKRFRSFTGQGIFFSSFLFGFVAWFLGFILAYVIWGEWAAVIGILLLGVGVVPIGLVAAALNGYWELFFTLLVITALTFTTRRIGMLVQKKST